MMVQVPDCESQPIGSNCDATVKRASTTSGWNGFFKDKDGSKDDDVDDDCGDVEYDKKIHINVRFHPWEEPDTGDHDQAGFRAEPGLSWKQQQQQQQQKRTWIKLSWIA